MHTLSITVKVKGSVTPEQLVGIRESLQVKVDDYLLSLPVHTPSLAREIRVLENA